MAVYTTVSEPQVNELLQRFSLPMLQRLSPSLSGIENTTYFLTLQDGQEWVLTLFESLSQQALLPYVRLMQHYRDRQLPVPAPVTRPSQTDASLGEAIQSLVGKPAVLVPRAAGRHIESPKPAHCRLLGEVLAQLHLASPAFATELVNPCGLLWMHETADALSLHLSPDDRKLLERQLLAADTLPQLPLPRGIIHGDLFRDNVLFTNVLSTSADAAIHEAEDNSSITALIDFYNAGYDCLTLDLAICINDWCFDEQLRFQSANRVALLAGYQAVRPLTPLESDNLPLLLRIAACRFWLSRLAGGVKDPAHYQKLLLIHENTVLK